MTLSNILCVSLRDAHRSSAMHKTTLHQLFPLLLGMLWMLCLPTSLANNLQVAPALSTTLENKRYGRNMLLYMYTVGKVSRRVSRASSFTQFFPTPGQDWARAHSIFQSCHPASISIVSSAHKFITACTRQPLRCVIRKSANCNMISKEINYNMPSLELTTSKLDRV